MFFSTKSRKLSMLTMAMIVLGITLFLALPYFHLASLAQGSPVSNVPVVESEHPYANNENTEWIINNNSGLNASRIYFSRVELEDGVDRIEVYDEMDTLIQIIDTSEPDGLWSDIIPGTLVKLVLNSDGSGRAWGFEVTHLEPTDYTTLIYSQHPYANNTDETKYVLNDSANPPGTRVHFDRIELEENVDYIVIKHPDGTSYQWITGNYPNGFTSKAIPGEALQIQLVSDGSIQAWGYNIDAVQTSPPETPDDPPSFNDTLAESPHPYPSGIDQTWTIINPDPNAASSKIHFSRLEIAGYDILEIMDEDNVVIQRFGGGTDLDNVWSDYVPGRIVKVRLAESDWYEGWGFHVDAIFNSVSNPGLAQSPHGYPSGIDQTWTIVNPDPKAISSKIHFSRMDIAGYDVLQIMDENDVVIQTFGANTHLADVWSDYVPGRIVKIRLDENDWYEDWGFRADIVINSVTNPGLAQSPHPYPSGIDQIWTIINPNINATASKVHFSRIDIAGYDLLQIMDENNNVIQSFGANTHLTDVWSEYILGRTVKIRLDENDWYEDWGFRADDFYSDTEGPPPPAYFGGIYVTLLEPGTIYHNNILVANAQEPGEYKIYLTNPPNAHTIEIEYPNYTQVIEVNITTDGSIQINYLPPNTQLNSHYSTLESATLSGIYLVMPHAGTISLNGKELITSEESGEFRIILSESTNQNLLVEHHDYSQNLGINFNDDSTIYLPLMTNGI